MASIQTRRDFLKVLGNGVMVSAVLPSFLASCASKGTEAGEGHRMVNMYDDDKNYLEEIYPRASADAEV